MGACEPKGHSKKILIKKIIITKNLLCMYFIVIMKFINEIFSPFSSFEEIALNEEIKTDFCFSFLKILFLEREEGGEREGEKHPCVVASHAPSTGDLAHNPGMGPDWKLNQRHFGSQASTQSTKPHQPGLFFLLLLIFCL